MNFGSNIPGLYAVNSSVKRMSYPTTAVEVVEDEIMRRKGRQQRFVVKVANEVEPFTKRPSFSWFRYGMNEKARKYTRTAFGARNFDLC